MTLQEFTSSLTGPRPPFGLHPIAEALWHDGKGDWEQAHNIAQSREGTRDYDRLHAYLHRKEGDKWNAGYWYRRTGAAVFTGTLEEEWQELTETFLKK
ncbi:hypothetical protein ACFQ4C_03015 [Larkinella insperata]|uniref:Uncharacterized protein n=1 Tax=Larkinella insperata TaxID=332158 RepID=A0ABW3Q744_9BACT|nr:hypothetical protein [Larkinella insperata]